MSYRVRIPPRLRRGLAAALPVLLLLPLIPRGSPALEAQAREGLALVLARQTALEARKALEERDLSSADLIGVRTQGHGAVLTADGVELELLRTRVLEGMGRGPRLVSVPLGTLLGGRALNGLGPRLPLPVIPKTPLSGELVPQLLAAGEGRSRYRVLLAVTAGVRVLLPLGRLDMTVTVPVCLAETLVITNEK